MKITVVNLVFRGCVSEMIERIFSAWMWFHCPHSWAPGTPSPRKNQRCHSWSSFQPESQPSRMLPEKMLRMPQFWCHGNQDSLQGGQIVEWGWLLSRAQSSPPRSSQCWTSSRSQSGRTHHHSAAWSGGGWLWSAYTASLQSPSTRCPRRPAPYDWHDFTSFSSNWYTHQMFRISN